MPTSPNTWHLRGVQRTWDVVQQMQLLPEHCKMGADAPHSPGASSHTDL